MDRQSRAFRTAVVVEHRMLGAAFLGLLVLGGWFAHAVFNKSFTEYDEVVLRASTTGLQLPDHADVKLHGVRVGEVVGRRVVDGGVLLTLGLFPHQRDDVPAGVTARILPKTLFGEKYVALQAPEGVRGPSIASGAVIEQTDVAIEVERVLSDIYPLLRTVQPAEINYTLTALATALEGRGEALGENLSRLDGYLQRMNPRLPELVEDLRLLSEVSEVYRRAMPEVARLLRNGVTTGNTLVEKEAKVEALFTDVARFSSSSRDFLEANGDNIIRLGELSEPQLRLLEKYSPEYPCLLQGISDWIPQMNSGWRGHTLHINLETIPSQPTGYSPADDPEYTASTGPHCESLPDPPYSQADPAPQPPMSSVGDGVESGHGKFRPRAATGFDVTSGLAGTSSERAVVDAVAAPVMGVPVEEVPDVATLLFGPLARGAEVNTR